jgi:hypothetical protein
LDEKQQSAVPDRRLLLRGRSSTAWASDAAGHGLTVALVFVLGILNLAGAIAFIAQGKAGNSVMAGCFGLVMVGVSLLNHVLARRDEERE